MAIVDFVSLVHKSTKRDYLGRVTGYPKAEAATRAKEWGYDYWDGDRRIGYGGMHYDGRWRKVAQAMVDHYGLKAGDKVLDVGCGKGFLLYDFTQVLPGLEVSGLDGNLWFLDKRTAGVLVLSTAGVIVTQSASLSPSSGWTPWHG